MAFAEPNLVSKLLIVQGDPFIPGDPLISAVVNYPRGPSYSVSPFIRGSSTYLILLEAEFHKDSEFCICICLNYKDKQ